MSNDRQQIFFVGEELKCRWVITETLEQLDAEITCFPCASDCLEQLGFQRCDLLITDLEIPEMDGMELLTHAKVVAPWVPVLIISYNGDIPLAVEAIKLGAADFIEKPLDKRSFVEKVRSLLKGNGNHKHLDKPLTQSEQRVLQLILGGNSNKEIASLLSRSKRTVETHRSNIMNKLGADNLVDLFKQALAMGLVDELELCNS